jgi:lipopolysaccharide/colanic/teichoic acid biosynthesis glycosyltransferase
MAGTDQMRNSEMVMHGHNDMKEHHPRLFDEQFFKEAIQRERKRADRSGLAMALLLIGLPNRSDRLGTADVNAVAKALSAVTSEIDVPGWFEQSCVVGLIVPEINPADLTDFCDRLESSFRSAIALRGDKELAQRLSIRLRVYPEPTISDEKQAYPVDPLLYPELSTKALAIPNFQTFKRGMDIVFSALLLLLLLPAFAFIAVLVKLSSPGPVFFKQTRVGHLMKPFTMCKFRTMNATADHQVHHDYVSWFITASDQAQWREKPAVFKLTNDTRITRIGRFLRRTSLDELPQLWNVLIGDMSLIGPRPPLPYELQQYKPWHRGRVLEAKPGMTGLWQVVGRSRTTFDEMVRLDLRYARTMSLWSDIKILLATPAAMITGKGAC